MSVLAAESWIAARLNTGALAELPCIRFPCGEGVSLGIGFKHLSSRDTGPLHARVASVHTYLITVFAEGEDLGPLAELGPALDAALELQDGPTPYGYVFECRREGEYPMAERLKSGKIRQHHGGIYKLTVKGP